MTRFIPELCLATRRRALAHRVVAVGVVAALAVVSGAATPADGQEVGVSPLLSNTVQKNLGEAQRALGERQFESAAEKYQAAVEAARSFEPQVQEYLYEAALRRQENHPDEARALIDKALALEPQNAQIQALLGQVATEQQDYAGALEAYQKALELDAELIEAATGIWKICQQARQYQRAIEIFSPLTQKHPENEWFFHYLGKAHRENGSPEIALPAFREAVRINPSDSFNNREYLSALLNATVLPGTDTEGLGLDLGDASAPTDVAVTEYERLAAESKTAVPMVKLYLAMLCLMRGDADKALPILRQLALTQSLDLQLRYNVAENLHLAAHLRPTGQQQTVFAEAAEQYDRVLSLMEQGDTTELDVRIEYGKTLVGAGKLTEGLECLEEAYFRWHEERPGRPTQLYYELGKAHYAAQDKDRAEDYFRLFSRDVEAYFSVATRGTRTEDKLEALRTLADIYRDSGNYRSAVDVLRRGVSAIDQFGNRLRIEPSKSKEFRLLLADALLHDGLHEDCIVELRKLVSDPDIGGAARLLMAEAQLGLRRHSEALDQLRQVENTPAWNDRARTLAADALMADGKYTDALVYLDEAQPSLPNQERTLLRRAQCLVALHDPTSAATAYQQIIDRNPHSVPAWVGLGEIELQAARDLSGEDLVARLTKAEEHFIRAAKEDPTNPAVINQRNAATQQRLQAEGQLQSARDRTRVLLYMLGIVAALAAPLIYLFVLSRRQWAQKLFEEVLRLEQELKQVIREHVRTRWGGNWARLGTEDEFAGRFPYSYLQKKADRERDGDDNSDLLDATNFGHLVAIVDCGWKRLSFEDRAKDRKARELILAALNYVGNCRNAIFHSRAFEQKLGGSGHSAQNPVHHMNRQVRLSLKTIRDNFDLSVNGAGDRPASADDIPYVEAVPITQPPTPKQ